jgi:hypothetical protein
MNTMNILPLATLAGWMLEGVIRAGVNYVRTGGIAQAHARIMMQRGLIALATSAVLLALR